SRAGNGRLLLRRGARSSALFCSIDQADQRASDRRNPFGCTLMMYQDHFGLTCNPFRHAPSAEFFFAGRNHREALAALQWALSDPTGMALLTGDVGTGKTTVVRELFSRETRNLRAALVTNPRLGFDGMLESILHQLRLECPEERSAMLRALAQAAENLRVVIVIDEAQRLSDDALEEFRL